MSTTQTRTVAAAEPMTVTGMKAMRLDSRPPPKSALPYKRAAASPRTIPMMCLARCRTWWLVYGGFVGAPDREAVRVVYLCWNWSARQGPFRVPDPVPIWGPNAIKPKGAFVLVGDE